MADDAERVLFGLIVQLVGVVVKRVPAAAGVTEVSGWTVMRFPGLLMAVGAGNIADAAVLRAFRTVDPALPVHVYAPTSGLPPAEEVRPLAWQGPDATPLMVARLEDLPLDEPVPRGFAIAAVGMDAQYVEAVAVQTETLGESYGHRARLKRFLEISAPGSVHHLLARAQGGGVAAAILMLAAEFVSLWDIGTLPAFSGAGERPPASCTRAPTGIQCIAAWASRIAARFSTWRPRWRREPDAGPLEGGALHPRVRKPACRKLGRGPTASVRVAA